MIFASDLDRTIVYSERAILELGEKQNNRLKPVEQKDGRWVAYMPEDAFLALQEIAQTCLFIPVTTRITEQFNRFIIFEDKECFPYAITANGAVILYKGKPMEAWTELIAKKMQQETASQEELLLTLQRNKIHITGRLKEAGGYFFYYILESLPFVYDRILLEELVSRAGWRMSLQGRKLYFIPKAVSKGLALKFISDITGLTTIAGGGDSILDWDFLQHCQYRFVPNHGELAKLSAGKEFILTKNSGAAAGEEILKRFKDLIFSEQPADHKKINA
jgi:hydroxymethylpyrimidine pyrophosphatase-like HAD family hydrolase